MEQAELARFTREIDAYGAASLLNREEKTSVLSLVKLPILILFDAQRKENYTYKIVIIEYGKVK